MNEKEHQILKEKTKELRKETLKIAVKKGGGHLGGSFSEAEILIALYEKFISDQDKFILSKGHASFPLYIILRQKGFQPKIACHPDIDPAHGIWCTTGSLGHGLPIGVGMALANKLSNKKGKIYVLVGDGEIQEGTTWESSLLAVHHQMDNLVVILDYNKIQGLHHIDQVITPPDWKKVFQTLGYQAEEIDGHSFPEIIAALNKQPVGKPLMIIAHTIKGKGVKQMEDQPKWHAKNAAELSPAEVKAILNELDGKINNTK